MSINTIILKRMRISDECLMELSDNYSVIEDELSCAISLLWQLREFQQRLNSMPQSERSQSLLAIAKEFDEMISSELLMMMIEQKLCA